MEICLGVIILTGFVIGMFYLVPYLIEYFKVENRRVFVSKVDQLETSQFLLGKFSYTFPEWQYTLNEEFFEDKYKKGFGIPTGFRRREYTDLPEREPKIYFQIDKITLTDGQYWMEYTFNTAGGKKYGVHFLSNDLRKAKPLDRLEIKTRMVEYNVDGPDIEAEQFFSIPLPASAEPKMREILKAYGDSILYG